MNYTTDLDILNKVNTQHFVVSERDNCTFFFFAVLMDLIPVTLLLCQIFRTIQQF